MPWRKLLREWTTWALQIPIRRIGFRSPTPKSPCFSMLISPRYVVSCLFNCSRFSVFSPYVLFDCWDAGGEREKEVKLKVLIWDCFGPRWWKLNYPTRLWQGYGLLKVEHEALDLAFFKLSLLFICFHGNQTVGWSLVCAFWDLGLRNSLRISNIPYLPDLYWFMAWV